MRLTLLLALVLGLAPTVAGAQDAPPPPPPLGSEVVDDLAEPPDAEVSLGTEVTVVGSRLAEAPAGATVRVLTRDDLRKLPARTLPELLQTLPGLDVRRRGVEDVQADVGIRGADYNGTLLLVDGEPLNDPQSNHLTFDLDVPVDAIERIEVLYGAGAALYGSDAIGGVINIVTRGAHLGRSRLQVEGRVVHGTDSLDAGSARIALKASDRLSFALDASRAESPGFRDDTDLSTKSVRLSTLYDTPHGPVRLSLGYAGRSYGAYAFYGTRFPDQQETTRTRTARLWADLAFGAWTLSPSIALRAHADDFVLDRNRPSFYENLHDADRETVRLVGTRALPGASLALGVEGGRETISSSNLGDHRRDHGAAFLEVGIPFQEGAPQKGGLQLGLRADSYEGYGSRLSPHLSVALLASRDLKLRASVGTAFRVPTFTDLYYQDPQNLGNPSLAPEKAVNAELGATLEAGAVSLDGAVFHRRGTDLIDYVRTSSSEPYQARNLRRADLSGVEARAELVGSLGLLRRLALSATYTFVDLEKLSAEADGATEGKYVLDPLHTKWDLVVGLALPLGVSSTSILSYHARPSFGDGVLLLSSRLARTIVEGDILEAYVEGVNLGNVTYQERPDVPLPRRILTAGLHLTF